MEASRREVNESGDESGLCLGVGLGGLSKARLYNGICYLGLGLLPIHPHMSSATSCQWLADWRLCSAPRPGPGSVIDSMGPFLPQVSPYPLEQPQSPLVLPFSPTSSTTLKPPYFLYSALCLTLWNPTSGVIFLCLGSGPLSQTFLLLHFPPLLS